MTRREMLTGMAVAGATVALSAPTIAKTAPASRAAWDKAVARFQRFHAEHEAAFEAHSAVEERYFAARPDQPLAEFRIGDTVDSYHARIKTERAEFERLDAECASRTGFSQSEARQAEACDASWDALGELIATPAPDLVAVALKIELATEYGQTIDQLGPVLTDLRRFVSNGRA